MLKREPWNKGKTKATDERLLKSSITLSSRLRSGEIKLSGCVSEEFVGTEKHKNMSAKGGGYKEGSGRSHKSWVKDSFGYETCLQSSYELLLSQKLDEAKIRWIRPDHLPYNGRKYFPDFYLVDFDVFVDTKNDYLIKIDKDKIKAVIEQNQVDLRVLSYQQINAPVFQWLECAPDKSEKMDRNHPGAPQFNHEYVRRL